MASCITSQWSNSTSPQIRLTVTGSNASGKIHRLSWTLEYVGHGYAPRTSGGRSYSAVIDGETVASGSYDINGKSGTYTIANGTKDITRGSSDRNISFSLSFAFNLTWSGVYSGTRSASGTYTIPSVPYNTYSFNANGGSGAPGSVTKVGGVDFIFPSGKPTRTGHTFKGWYNSSINNGTLYQPGQTVVGLPDQSITWYASWTANTYTVKYNANGGSGAPGQQTKTYGVTLTLSSTKPTRTNYTFKGWGTSSGSTTVAYAAGGSYTANVSVTLYAIWELNYTKPRITNMSADRCDSAGTLNDDGAYALIKFDWATDETVSSIKILCNGVTTIVAASGTFGSVNKVIGESVLSTESSYPVIITVEDASGITRKTGTVQAASYIVDVSPTGGIGFNTVAPAEGFYINQRTKFMQPKWFMSASGTSGSTGYVKICTMTALESYVNSGVTFVISQRGRTVSFIFLSFYNNDTTAILLSNAYVIGDSTVYTLTSGNTCEIWVMKSEAYDLVTLCDFYENTGYTQEYMNGIRYDFTDEFSSSVPSGAVKVPIWVSVQGSNSRPVILQHIGLGNGIALQGELTTGSYTNILSINTSNKLEFNWPNGGLGGRIRKQLWSGTWTSGSLTISELPYYNVFLIAYSGAINDDSEDGYLIAMRNAAGTRISGVGAVNGSSDIRLVTVDFTVSGTSITYTSSRFVVITNGNTLSSHSAGRIIRKITGLL